LQFEKAALLRDQIKELKRVMEGPRSGEESKPSPARRVNYAKRPKGVNR